MLLLGIDTCGPSGSVALASLAANELTLLGQVELAARSYSATLVAAVDGLLAAAGTRLGLLRAIVVANGPGSFTGVRVGLSAVKGLAEPTGIPVLAVSRLAVLAHKGNVQSAALDAHRHEIFLRWKQPGSEAREFLAGSVDLGQIDSHRGRIAVCDHAAADLLSAAWPGIDMVRVATPTAFDTLQFALPGILAESFSDLSALDGHYLRRSDAEIFGEPEAAARSK